MCLLKIRYKSTFAPNEGKSVKKQLSVGNVTRMSEHRHTADEHLYLYPYLFVNLHKLVNKKH